MSTLDTPRGWTTTGAAEAVVVPRRHVVAIAILMCVPLPLLSLAATVVPLPQIAERAAASFISIAAPVARSESSLIREKAVPVRSVEITHRPAERGSSAVSKPTTRTRSQTAPRATPARAAVSKTVVQADAGRTLGKPAEPSGGAADEPAGTGPPSADGKPGPGASTDPPTSAPPNSVGEGSGGGGSGSGGGSGGSGSGGDGSNGGGSGNGTDPPGHGGADPPDGGNGNPDPPASDPGSGSGSPPEPPPTSNRPPDNGAGKP